MSGVIKKNVCYLVFEETWFLAFYPDGLHASCYPTAVVMLLFTVNPLELYMINVLIMVKNSPVFQAASEMAQKGVSYSQTVSEKK